MRELLTIEKAMNRWYRDESETYSEVMYKVNFQNDEFDDCEFFDSLEDAEAFADEMTTQGYETEIKRAA